MSNGLLPAGYLRFDGEKYVIDDQVEIIGPAGPNSSIPTGTGVVSVVGGVLNPIAGNVILSSQVTGILPIANQAPQTLSGDLSGTTANASVVKIHGAAIATGIGLATGSTIIASSPTALAFGALNLANPNAVVGILGNTNGGLGTSNGTLNNGTLSGNLTISSSEIAWNGDTLSKTDAIDLMGSLQTTNATPAIFNLFNTTANTLYSVDALITAVTADVSVRAIFKVSGLVYGDGSNVATIDGSITSNGIGTSAGSLVATIIVDGAHGVQVQVTGIAATSIRWGIELHASSTVH